MATPERKAAKALSDKAYREKNPYSGWTEEQKAKKRAKCLAYHAANKAKVKSQKRAYDKTEAGKLSKKRCEERYKANGKRAAAEKRRAERELSEARKLSKLRYQIRKRSGELALSEFDVFVLDEANRLARLREKIGNKIKWHIDHVIPVSLGGSSTYTNIQVVPAKWNQSKSNKHSNRMFNVVPG